MNGESHGHIQAEMAWYNISRIPWESVMGNEWSIPFMWRLYVYLHENHKQNQPDVGKYTIRWMMISIHFSMTYWKFQLNGPSFQPVKTRSCRWSPMGGGKWTSAESQIPMNFWWWLMTLRMSCYNPPISYMGTGIFTIIMTDWFLYVSFLNTFMTVSEYTIPSWMVLGYNLVIGMPSSDSRYYRWTQGLLHDSPSKVSLVGS